MYLVSYTNMQSLLCKGGKIPDKKTCGKSLFASFWDVLHFSPMVINLQQSPNICCELKKVVARSSARVYFEQQILDSSWLRSSVGKSSAPVSQQSKVRNPFKPEFLFLSGLIFSTALKLSA